MNNSEKFWGVFRRKAGGWLICGSENLCSAVTVVIYISWW